MSFQKGDRVIRIKGDWMKGFRGTVVGFSSWGDLLIDLDPEFKKKDFDQHEWGWHPSYVEHEDLYLSPLWRALE